jgi:hypothetical protein
MMFFKKTLVLMSLFVAYGIKASSSSHAGSSSLGSGDQHHKYQEAEIFIHGLAREWMKPAEVEFLDSVVKAAFKQVQNEDEDLHLLDASVVGEKLVLKDMKGLRASRTNRVPNHHQDHIHTGGDRALLLRKSWFRPRTRLTDYTILMDWGCRLCINYNRRILSVSSPSEGDIDVIDQVEELLCNMLRASPYDLFQTASDCTIVLGDLDE